MVSTSRPATKLNSDTSVEMKDDAFRAAFDATDAAIQSLSLTLPRALTEANVLIPAYILPNMFVLAAVIQLHLIFAVEHNHLAPSYQKCLDAATDMVDIINAMEEQRIDFSFLELHIGVSLITPQFPSFLVAISRFIVR